MALAVRPVALQPPANTAPIADDGTHSQAWAGFHEDVATLLNQVRATVVAKTGVTDGSDATAGQVGEYLSASGGPVSLSSGVAHDVVTLALTAGDWDVSGVVVFTPTGNPSHFAAGISTTAGIIGTNKTDQSANFSNGAQHASGAGMVARMNSAGTQTAHLVGLAAFSGSMTAAGTISARRMR